VLPWHGTLPGAAHPLGGLISYLPLVELRRRKIKKGGEERGRKGREWLHRGAACENALIMEISIHKSMLLYLHLPFCGDC